MTHDQLLDLVDAEARRLGALVYWTRDSRRSVPGYPDLTIAGRRGVAWIEVKTGGGRLKPKQTAWRWMLLASGQRYMVVRPADWAAGTVQAALARIA